MNKLFLTRLASFLSEYLNNNGRPLSPSEELCRAGCMMLVADGVMTVNELRQEALEKYAVIIPWDYFREVMV